MKTPKKLRYDLLLLRVDDLDCIFYYEDMRPVMAGIIK